MAFELLLCALLCQSPAAPSPDVRMLATDFGLVVSLRERTTGPGAAGLDAAGRSARFVIALQPAGLPEQAKLVTVEGRLAAIERAQVHDARTVALTGPGIGGSQALVIIDVPSASIIFQTTCGTLEAHPGRYFCTQRDGAMRSYDVAHRQDQPAWEAVDGAVHILTSGSIAERRALLRALRISPQLSTSAVVRRGLQAELRRRVAEDRVEAAQRPALKGLRWGSETRDYLGDLIEAVGRFSDPADLATFTATDSLAVPGALAQFGADAVPVILDALRQPSPPGYSMYHRATLFDALVLILQAHRADGGIDRGPLAAAAHAALRRPASYREALSALNLAEELDDEACDAEVAALADSADVARQRGIVDAAQAYEVQQRAQAIVARRVDVRADD